MVNLRSEFDALQQEGILPDKNYFSRFSKPYDNIADFWDGLITLITSPLVHTAATIFYAIYAVDAVLRTVGNLLIIEPVAAFYALADVSPHLAIVFAVVVMAPIHALTAALEVLTRTILSWFSEEPKAGLTELSFGETFKKQSENSTFLLSSKNINRGRFFAPHKDVLSFLNSVATPLVSGIGSGFSSLSHAAQAVYLAIQLFANLVIAKPKHAGECARDFGVQATLAILLALMIPINVLVDFIAFITKLGSTWVDSLKHDKDAEPLTYSP
jgi:hypothetical protein